MSLPGLAPVIMQIGEKQSETIDPQTCIYAPNGDVYEDRAQFILGKPLDVGRLFYVKLRRACPPEVEVEVLWDHFHNELVALLKSGNSEFEVRFKEPFMARSDKLVYIDDIVNRAQEVLPSLL